MNDSQNKEIGNRIKWLRKNKGLTQGEFSKKIMRDASTVSKIEQGLVELSSLVCLAICNTFAVRERWLLYGEEPIYDDRWKLLEDRAKELGQDVYYKLIMGTASEKRLQEVYEDFRLKGDVVPVALVRETSPEYGDFVTVPQVEGEISAGGGMVPNNNIELRVAFRRDWIARRGDPKNMSLIRVSGDSMEPTLVSGDLVLVDHGRNYIDGTGGIYALVQGDYIIIKRIQVLSPGNRLKIISDNHRYEPSECDPDELKVNGKVIWFGREVER